MAQQIGPAKHTAARYYRLIYILCGIAVAAAVTIATARERAPQTGTVLVQTGQPDCRIDLDSQPAGVTDTTGKFVIPSVDAGEHYVHAQCSGKPEASFLISARSNDATRLDATADSAATPAAKAEERSQLPRLVQQAVQLRSQGHLDEAVSALRHAINLDPRNSDLHRELGITFLQAKEWKRARVEMLEALHEDQNDADAHNGLGYALEKLGDIDAALKEYQLATKLQPDDPTYHTHYIEAVLKIQGRKEGKK